MAADVTGYPEQEQQPKAQPEPKPFSPLEQQLAETYIHLLRLQTRYINRFIKQINKPKS